MRQEIFAELMLRDLELLIGAEVPAVFVDKNPKPLKINIDMDIVARFPEVDTVKLRRWFRLWVGRGAHQKVLMLGGDRFDLDGQPSGTVDELVREVARKRIVSNRKASSGCRNFLPGVATSAGISRRESTRPTLHLPFTCARNDERLGLVSLYFRFVGRPDRSGKPSTHAPS